MDSESWFAVRAGAGLESQAQHVSAAKAAFTLERLCPIKERGSGISDCDDGGGVVLKRIRPDPAGEIVQVSLTGPSHVEFNVGRSA